MIAKKTIIIAMILVVLGTAGCFVYMWLHRKHETESQGSVHNVDAVADDALTDFLDGMTLEEKVGQMFVLRTSALNNGVAPKTMTDKQSEMIKQYAIGGVILFDENLSDKATLVQYLSDLQSNSKYTLFVGVDEEGGIVSRLGRHGNMDVTRFPNMAEIGATGDTSKAFDVGDTLGKQLKALGVNLDFAPIADVNTNPDNPVIGVRSFGSDANLVASMVEQEVKGLQGQNVSATLKHFPGHGDTQTDSHAGETISTQNKERLKSVEFVPFEAGIKAGVDFIMAAHIVMPNADSSGLPASLSSTMLTDILRGELGYKNIIITDSMSMGAITGYYSSADAAVLAVKAGVDILLSPVDFVGAYNAVIAAVKSGEIPESRIDESVRRIMATKNVRGLIEL